MTRKVDRKHKHKNVNGGTLHSIFVRNATKKLDIKTEAFGFSAFGLGQLFS